MLRLTGFFLREGWSRRTWAFLFVMLLLGGLMTWGLPHLDQEAIPPIYQPVGLSIVDDDRSIISRILIEELSGIELIDRVYLESFPKAKERLAANETALIIVIPPGFFEQTAYSRERNPLVIHQNNRMPAETAVITRLFNHIADGIVSVQAAFFAYRDLSRPLFSEDQAYYRMLDAVFLRLFFKMIGRKSFTEISGGEQLQSLPYLISTLVCLLTLLTALLNMLQVQQDRRNNLIDRLRASGCARATIFMARQLAGLPWLAAGMTPLLAGLMLFLPQMNMTQTTAAILLLYWVGSAWFQVWGHLGSSGDEKLMGAWMILFLMLLLGGCIYPAALLPDVLQPVLRLSPAWWAGQMVYDAASGRLSDIMTWPGWLFHLAVAVGLAFFTPGHRFRSLRLTGRRAAT